MRGKKKIRSKFWTLKNGYYPILYLCFSSFLSYNFFQQILFAKKLIPTLKKSELLFQGGPKNFRLNYVLYNFGLHFGQNLFLQAKFFCKHFHLVISQLLDKIFQPFKEQKWCQSLGAPSFGVNSECFSQLLRIRSKTPNFGVTKNSARHCTCEILSRLHSEQCKFHIKQVQCPHSTGIYQSVADLGKAKGCSTNTLVFHW